MNLNERMGSGWDVKENEHKCTQLRRVESNNKEADDNSDDRHNTHLMGLEC